MSSLVADTALVDTHAKIADSVEIGPFCVIGPDVTIQGGTRIPKVAISTQVIRSSGVQCDQHNGRLARLPRSGRGGLRSRALLSDSSVLYRDRGRRLWLTRQKQKDNEAAKQ